MKLATGILFQFLLLVSCLVTSISEATAQTQWWLYGIGSGNTLIRIDPNTFVQTVVGTITPANQNNQFFSGIEFDPLLNRTLVSDSNGHFYVIDQDTAVASEITPNFQPDVQSFAQENLVISPDPSYDIFASVESGGATLVGLAAARNSDGTFTTTPRQFSRQSGDLYSYAWRSSPPALFSVISYDSMTAYGIQELDPLYGFKIGSNGSFPTEPSEAGAISGMVFHPVTTELFANSSNGALLKIDETQYLGDSVVVLSQPDINGAQRDLAFFPVTPTPTPTPTSTPTPSDCPSGVITVCGCDKIEFTLSDGTVQCAPVDTVTRRSVPPPAEVAVEASSVAVVLKEFSGISDGRRLLLLLNRSLRAHRFDLLELESQNDDAHSNSVERPNRNTLSLRYNVIVAPRGRDARRDQRTRLITKRNRITVRKLSPGTYSVRYRVLIFRGKNKVGRTRFSRNTRFKIRGQGQRD